MGSKKAAVKATAFFEPLRPWNAVTRTGDPYSNCRDRLVVLITDGRASMGEAMGGYPTTIEAIESLKSTPPAAKSPKVYVVGYNLANEDASLLDEVADHADGTFIADTAIGLRTALAEIFALAQAEVQSRTEVVYTNATQSSKDMQYQFNAAFQADPDNPTNLKGFLNQTVYQCSDDCIGISGPVRAARWTSSQSTTNSTRAPTQAARCTRSSTASCTG